MEITVPLTFRLEPSSGVYFLSESIASIKIDDGPHEGAEWQINRLYPFGIGLITSVDHPRGGGKCTYSVGLLGAVHAAVNQLVGGPGESGEHLQAEPAGD
ncbi:hypothetical protein [Phenylobacterium sp.]|uniref:hypothetical protein n=1 Tax=Phenylobacterium sp. TaxID=1871053 RepID=UPI001992E1E7|nr:hypothetical protein [Phenylobacterium sp.]MBC7168703.1 hypothetical protein [Phenylobacterium sp.]